MAADNDPPSSQNLTNGSCDGNEWMVGLCKFLASAKKFHDSDIYRQLELLIDENKSLKSGAQNYETALRTLSDTITRQDTAKTERETKFKQVQTENEKIKHSLAAQQQKLDEFAAGRQKEADELTRLYQKADDLETAKKVLTLRDNEIEGLKKDLQQKIDDFETVRQEKEDLRRRLENIRKLHEDMPLYKPVETEQPALSKIADEADKWAIEFLFQELDTSVFHSKEWAMLQTTMNDDFQDMFPASNSIPAKQVRYAFGLQVLGNTVEKLILQSVFINESAANECAKFLSSLGKVPGNAGHESHIRSAIRKANSGSQRQIGEKRAEIAAGRIVANIRVLIPSEKRDACRDQVSRICTMALDAWEPLQGIRDQTVVNFTCTHNDREWKVQRLPTSTAAQHNTNRVPLAVTGSSDAQRTRDFEPIEIWPVIHAGKFLINHGIYFTRDQLHAAQKEIQAERRANRGKRRNQSIDDGAVN